MVFVEPQVTKRTLPAIYRPAAVRGVLALFLATFLPTPWFATILPRSATPQLGQSLTEFCLGIPLGLVALALSWRLFTRALPTALQGKGGFASLNGAFLIIAIPFLIMTAYWLPLIRWSLLGGYFLGAGAGFFVCLLIWARGLPEDPPSR